MEILRLRLRMTCDDAGTYIFTSPKYGLPYEVFYVRVTTDDEFVENLRDTHPTWERDFNAWEYYVEELSEWLGRLESISTP